MYHINMLHVCDEPRQIFSVTLSIRYYLSTLLGRINDSILFQVIFFTAQCYASAAYAVALCPSVCLSVCLSQVEVRFQYQNSTLNR